MSQQDQKLNARRDVAPGVSASGEPRKEVLEIYLLAIVAVSLSWGAFIIFYFRGEVLLSGDAVAHMTIARRMVDSMTPGPLQLGTVWLPLPHLVLLPLIWSRSLWQTGLAGSLPSMAFYVVAVVGVFRLVRNSLISLAAPSQQARLAAWFAALALAFNPNLLYLQATAMTEPLYVALFVWVAVFFTEFWLAMFRGDDIVAQKRLTLLGATLLLATLTRYDGWFTAVILSLSVAMSFALAFRRRGLPITHALTIPGWRRAAAKFLLLVALGPCSWILYNAIRYGNPLEFANGPYSAAAIQERNLKAGDPEHPGWHSPKIASIYYVAASKLNVAQTNQQGRLWVWSAILGTLLLILVLRPLWPWLLLWVPLPFYAISIAYGAVPIFVPQWYPFSYYNVRYGIQLLPAFVIFGSALLFLLMHKAARPLLKVLLFGLALGAVLASYWSVIRNTPVTLLEARVNSAPRMALENRLSIELAKLPESSLVLMYLGEHSGAVQRIGRPFSSVLNEGNKKRWEAAMNDLAHSAEYIVATKGDEVSRAVAQNSTGLNVVVTVEAKGQQPVTIYRSSRFTTPAH